MIKMRKNKRNKLKNKMMMMIPKMIRKTRRMGKK